MSNIAFKTLQDKVVLITGAGSGIGAACSRIFHAQGARVVLTDVNSAGLVAMQQELGDARTLVRVVSATEREALDGLVNDILSRWGRLDVVFANAGIACEPPNTMARMPESVFERIIEVNLLGVWRTVRACLPAIRESQGHVLMTASIYAYVNGMANSPYAAAKAGVEMLGRSLRAELAGTGATAGVLYPGWVSTPIAHGALGADPIASELVKFAFKGSLKTPITPEVVAMATAKGICRRSARITVPGRWIPVSLLRGLIGPLSDWFVDRSSRIHQLVRQLEQR
ncbi:SDR family NAD(P)-dependent oxidoreductase [Rhodoferax mekongensis]|uniref:SDR family NAD(P)-dependent oxidoreductase n=1 Tax=Rhodoferax mekongensis TaxID=3068341 RepID=UPI0028BEB771|nr:SDR family NAD(P)-dependent oxidoreductase [Rhodoferax sp. TBRC 17199]MDT7516195.1 SDR family NAD(P)-dependent oxidoreductase [Rhodoferax sp. TBRC 17199]